MISPEQRKARRHHLGSSDAPAIVGVCPWRTPAEVYWSKIAETDDRPTAAMEIGNRMEGPLLDMAAERYGPLRRDVFQVAEISPILAANLDGLTFSDNENVECKYVGPRHADAWGESETDEIPDNVAIQVQHQMAVFGLKRTHVAAAIVRPNDGLTFAFYHLDRDQDLINDLVTAEIAFWKRHVEPRIPPDGGAPLELLKKIRRQPASLVDLGIDAAAAWESRAEYRAKAKEAEKSADTFEAALLAALGTAEAGLLPDGRILKYLEENAGARCDVKSLRESHPGIYEEFCHDTTRRVLRISKLKG